jgi:tripartite-type tricarboxylate transporter receptor subunit TctC
MRINVVLGCFGSLLAAICLTESVIAAADIPAYPAKPIRMVVGQEAGSALDNSVRIITPALGEALQQQIVVDNRPGVGGMIAMQVGLASVPDGYTLINAGSPQMIAPFLFKKLSYDLFRDFVPIGRLTIVQNALVINPALPANNVQSLVELLKSKPGQFNMASAGIGSASHLAGVLFNAVTGIQALHVPYRGGAAAVAALISSEAQYLVTPLSATIGHIRAGRLKVLGVGGEARARQLPDVPTMEEAGIKGYRSTGWNGIFTPRGTPPAATARLVEALNTVYSNPALLDQILRAGVEPGLMTGAAFTKFMREEMARFGAAAKAANLKAE